MQYMYQYNVANRLATFLQGCMMTKFFKNILTKIVRAQELRAMIWQLSNLSDKELRDIGINRCDIVRRVYDIHA